MKKNAKLAALAILVLAAVAALSVGITLAVVNARMPAAAPATGSAVRPGRKQRLPGMRRPRSRQSRPKRIPSPFPASIS